MKKQKILRNKKGFTLIEIIVVLVIIALLVAAAIPSMIGFVDDARGKAYASEARVGFVAAQAVVTEMVASGNKTNPTSDDVLNSATFKNMVSDVEGKFSAIEITASDAKTPNRVTGITYVCNNGYEVVISYGQTTVSKVDTTK